MRYDLENERDPFEGFGDIEAANDDTAFRDFESFADEPATIEPREPIKVKTGFSWAGFLGGFAALLWIGAAIGGPLSYYGVDAVMTMDPAMQAGLIALAFGPALLFWVAASAAGEALKARKLAVELTRIAHDARTPSAAAEEGAQRLTNIVKHEIENLNDAVASALDRLAELERSTQRNAALFHEAVTSSRENVETMAYALQQERNAIIELNGDLKGQTEGMANSIGRQIRLMREASKLVKTEIVGAEDALQSYLNSFSASASTLGDRTAQMHRAADNAAAASNSLNGSMSQMLEGLAEATRLTETAKRASAEAVLAANETATAVRETTRSAVFEAKRAAQLIRAENQAMQDAAAETLAKLAEAAESARAASNESQAAAERYTAKIEQRLTSLAATAGAKRAPAAPAPVSRVERTIEREIERPVERSLARTLDRVAAEEPEFSTLHAAANAAVTRSSRPRVEPRDEQPTQPRRVFKGFGGWGNFMPPREDAPKAANEERDAFDLADFGTLSANNPDVSLKHSALDLVAEAGVDLDNVLDPRDLDMIAQRSRDGASARRRAVENVAPVAVSRIARQLQRDIDARAMAAEFRARPDLAKSDNKGEGSDLVRAYLLIDAALAS